jgi:Transglycosylase SLT domain
MDRVIGGLIWSGHVSGMFRRIEARQGIILGKSARSRLLQGLRKPGFGRTVAPAFRRRSPETRHQPRSPSTMKHLLSPGWIVAMAALLFPAIALAQHAGYDELVATHAKANGVPEALVHRVIARESGYRPGLVGRGGAIGLMQIKLATARGLGYTGDAAGLRDPETNLTYAVKYLAGAYRAANGDHNRAVHYYAAGYYYAAKQQRLAPIRHSEPVLAGTSSKEAVIDAGAEQVPK